MNMSFLFVSVNSEKIVLEIIQFTVESLLMTNHGFMY